MAIATHGYEQTGLSVDIHVTYIGIAKEGDALSIEARTTKVGRNLGFTTSTISTEGCCGPRYAHEVHSPRSAEREGMRSRT